tara:strand:+ start:846 stop:1976 length:1131 start_codon:yes stop_codon:yes gene_type:complete
MKQFFGISILALALAACSEDGSTATSTVSGDTAADSGMTETPTTTDNAQTSAQASTSRPIRIVGSSTVFPFTTATAESFGARTNFATPVVESTGTGGGMRLFCNGVGTEHPDITGASRQMRASEYEQCQANGVREIVEIPIGFDGIVFANTSSGPELDISRDQIWLALAAHVPAEDCTMIENPYESWTDIDATLPAEPIEVFGPPPTSGTRDAFVELGMEAGAEMVAEATGCEISDEDAARIREDGAWIDAGENDNAIVQTLVNTPTAFGVFGYSFLAQNSDRIQGGRVDGVMPEFDHIASGDYPISRSLFVYVKRQHVGVTPGIEEFITELTSDDAWGEFGYLADRGLIPAPDAQRMDIHQRAADLVIMDGPPEH